MPSTQPASTAAPNPLEDSLARIMGTDPLSTTTGTQGLINYEDLGNRGQQPGDVITIQGDPGTGATTAETWAHDIELENQLQKELEFEWQQRQQEWENTLSAQQAALSQSQFGLQQAEESRAAGLYGSQQQAAALANQAARQDLALKASAEKRAQDEAYMKYGGLTRENLEAMQHQMGTWNAITGNAPHALDTEYAYGQLMAYGPGGQYYTPGMQVTNTGWVTRPGTSTPQYVGSYANTLKAAQIPGTTQYAQSRTLARPTYTIGARPGYNYTQPTVTGRTYSPGTYQTSQRIPGQA